MYINSFNPHLTKASSELNQQSHSLIEFIDIRHFGQSKLSKAHQLRVENHIYIGLIVQAKKEYISVRHYADANKIIHKFSTMVHSVRQNWFFSGWISTSIYWSSNKMRILNKHGHDLVGKHASTSKQWCKSPYIKLPEMHTFSSFTDHPQLLEI